MVSKSKKKAGVKKAPRTSTNRAARKAAKKSSTKKKAAKSTAKAKKKAPARKTAKKAPKKKATKKVSKNRTAAVEDSDETTLTLDDLADVDDLVADATPKSVATAPKSKKRGTQTPTVPRSVKPTPKIADLEMNPDVLEFIEAVDKYRQEYCRPFPTWTEVFYLLRELGYTKR